MDVRFICYEKNSERVVVMSDSLPDNAGYVAEEKVIIDGNKRLAGVKWDQMGYVEFDPAESVDFSENEAYYNEPSGVLYQGDPHFPDLLGD